LDDYEVCLPGNPERSEYDRILILARFRGREYPAWVYRYRKSLAGLRPIPSGDFRSFFRKKPKLSQT
jgi:hypothetical protein